MSNAHLVFLDVDGTITDSLGRIASSTPRAIAQARQAGHTVMLCTGRGPADIHPDVLAIGFDGVVSAGGAFVERDGEVLLERVMTRDDASFLFDYYREHNLPFFAQTVTHTYGDAEASHRMVAAVEAVREKLAARGIDVDASREALEVIPFEDAPADLLDHVAKTVFVGADRDAYAGVERDLRGRFNCVTGSIPVLGTASGEISALGVNKGTTIEMLLPRFGVDRARAVGVGDSPNDLEMFAAVGTAVAMGNATEAVKAQADHVTTDVLDDGIHAAFTHLGLI